MRLLPRIAALLATLFLPCYTLGGVSPAEQITSIYRQHNPTKLDSVPKLLEKYAGHEDQLLDSVMEKYGLTAADLEGMDAGAAASDDDDAVHVEQDEAPGAAAASPASSNGAQPDAEVKNEDAEEQREAIDPALEPEDQMVQLLITQLEYNLMQTASRLGRKLTELRNNRKNGREAQQVAVAKYLEELLEVVEQRPTLTLFGDTDTQVTRHYDSHCCRHFCHGRCGCCCCGCRFESLETNSSLPFSFDCLIDCHWHCRCCWFVVAGSCRV